jgi:hypothetical protein
MKTDAQQADAEVRTLLETIAKGLTAGDGKAVAKHWAMPAFVLGDTMAMPIGSLDEVAEFMGGAKAEYQKMGVTDTKPQIRKLDWITDKIAVADVRWPYLDDAGTEKGAESSIYTLVRDEAGDLKVRSIVMRGVEKPKH